MIAQLSLAVEFCRLESGHRRCGTAAEQEAPADPTISFAVAVPRASKFYGVFLI